MNRLPRRTLLHGGIATGAALVAGGALLGPGHASGSLYDPSLAGLGGPNRCRSRTWPPAPTPCPRSSTSWC